jgi:hypothetical protein
VSLRRLGKMDANKTRKLLVILSTEGMAQEMLSRARNLRGSSDNYIATSIFINRDLSPEESRSAFERRQTRRTSGQSHIGQNNGTRIFVSSKASVNYINLVACTATNSTHGPREAVRDAAMNSAAVTAPVLSANAIVFQPSVPIMNVAEFPPLDAVPPSTGRPS